MSRGVRVGMRKQTFVCVGFVCCCVLAQCVFRPSALSDTEWVNKLFPVQHSLDPTPDWPHLTHTHTHTPHTHSSTPPPTHTNTHTHPDTHTHTHTDTGFTYQRCLLQRSVDVSHHTFVIHQTADNGIDLDGSVAHIHWCSPDACHIRATSGPDKGQIRARSVSELFSVLLCAPLFCTAGEMKSWEFIRKRQRSSGLLECSLVHPSGYRGMPGSCFWKETLLYSCVR